MLYSTSYWTGRPLITVLATPVVVFIAVGGLRKPLVVQLGHEQALVFADDEIKTGGHFTGHVVPPAPASDVLALRGAGAAARLAAHVRSEELAQVFALVALALPDRPPTGRLEARPLRRLYVAVLDQEDVPKLANVVPLEQHLGALLRAARVHAPRALAEPSHVATPSHHLQ